MEMPDGDPESGADMPVKRTLLGRMSPGCSAVSAVPYPAASSPTMDAARENPDSARVSAAMRRSTPPVDGLACGDVGPKLRRLCSDRSSVRAWLMSSTE